MPRQHLEPNTSSCQLVHHVVEVEQIAAKTVKLPHKQRVACS